MSSSKKHHSRRKPDPKHGSDPRRSSGSGHRQGRDNQHSQGAAGKPLIKEETELIDWLEKIDQPFVLIPMAGRVPCLNVSVATGVCLYEVVRQRSASN